jgi:GH24 family phage-related lysozyme (muramidase)
MLAELLSMILTLVMSIAAIGYSIIKNVNSIVSPTTIPSTIPTVPSTIITNENLTTIPIANSTTMIIAIPTTNLRVPQTTIIKTTQPKVISTTSPKEIQSTIQETNAVIPSSSTLKTILETSLQESSIIYYPACDKSYDSIVNALNSIGVDSSITNRGKIAELNGISNFSGTAEQNTKLLNLLKEGKLIKSISSSQTSTTSTTSAASPEIKETNINKNTNVKDLVTSLLIYEEGTKKNNQPCIPYKDSLDKPTIGYGKLCKDVEVTSDKEAEKVCADLVSKCTNSKALEWLSEDIDEKTSCIQKTTNIKAAYDKASDYRKCIIISMAYQMGCKKLAKFVKTLNLMAKEEWDEAATEMLISKWANQTENRANRHSYVIRHDNCGDDFCKLYGWKKK